MRLFNTLGGRVEPFAPGDPARVTMYVCGPTVYDRVHIGNVRPLVVFDVLYRLLRARHPQVVYARNLTDIDDKIIAAAKANNETPADLAARYTRAFHADIAPLNTLAPTIEPRATEHVEAMIEMIAALLDKGHAYEAHGHVLFEIDTMRDYGALSRRRRADQIAGARVEVAPWKKDPADFVLWKPSDDTQPGWDSPWGRGRPGWHLECSVMAARHLGEVIDIHGGGRDLVFPHHENELAQSRCAFGTPCLARHWVHNGYITVAGEKMAKSAGNFETLRALLDQHHGETVRYAILATHYRKPLNWSDDILDNAKHNLDRLYRALPAAAAESAANAAEPAPEIEAALADDLNTPRALDTLHHLAADPARAAALRSAAGPLLGLLQETPDAWFKWRAPQADGLAPAEVEQLLQQRERARAARDWQTADRIRAQLADGGVLIEDRADGVRWRRA